MRRSAITNNDNDNNKSSITTTTNEINNHQHKRSLEDYGFLTNTKRRRHLSSQNANIDINNDNDTISLPSIRKKTRTKSKNQTILNSSIDSNNEHNSINDCQTSRKTSSRHILLSSQQMNEITLPNWECMCPNIDQILSNKHTQSGVFSHEIQLVQQELEALLSMSIVRENILKDLYKPSINQSDTIRSKIRKHKEAERIYSTKKIQKKSLPPLINHHYQNQKQNNPNLLLDRQVAIAPILGARIDRIWSDINTYHHKISSNDILMIENLVKFNCHLENKLVQLKSEYNNNNNNQLIEQLNEENYEQLVQISQINPLITHYVDRTTIGLFQSKLYEHIGQTSPVYKTPISSPMHGRILGNNCEYKDNGGSLRISPRLHSNNHKIGLFSLSNLKFDDDSELLSSSSSSLIKSKKKSKFISSPSSEIKFQQRLQYVQNYLIDQHPIINETVKRQLFNELKLTKKRKTSISIPLITPINNINHCTDIFQSKLSTLISLLHECSTLSSCALKRARLQSDNEQIWQKLNTIERDLESLIEKLDITGGNNNNNSNKEKAFQNLTQLLTDWNKYEQEFDQQLEELFIIDQ